MDLGVLYMKFIGSKRGLILIILGLLIVGVISFSYYVSDYYHADNNSFRSIILNRKLYCNEYRRFHYLYSHCK